MTEKTGLSRRRTREERRDEVMWDIMGQTYVTPNELRLLILYVEESDDVLHRTPRVKTKGDITMLIKDREIHAFIVKEIQP